MRLSVKDVVGKSMLIEDAIVVREIIKDNIAEGVTLDFEGFERIPSTFLNCLFSDLITQLGRDYIFSNIDVKNLSNYNDYSRVVLGTTFSKCM